MIKANKGDNIGGKNLYTSLLVCFLGLLRVLRPPALEATKTDQKRVGWINSASIVYHGTFCRF